MNATELNAAVDQVVLTNATGNPDLYRDAVQALVNAARAAVARLSSERRSPPGNLAQREIGSLKSQVTQLKAALKLVQGDHGVLMGQLAAREAKDAGLPAAPAPTEQPEHETIVREGNMLTCTACGTSKKMADPCAASTEQAELPVVAWLIDSYDRFDKMHQSVELAPLADNVMDDSSEAEPLCTVASAKSVIAAALAARQAPTAPDATLAAAHAAIRAEPWTDAQREQFRRDMAKGDRCHVCCVLLGGDHFPGCSQEAAPPPECPICDGSGTAFGKTCTCGVGSAISQMHRSTGLRCQECCARAGESHLRWCSAAGKVGGQG